MRAELPSGYKMADLVCWRALHARAYGLLFTLLLPGCLLAQEALDGQTRFATRSAVEKICLQLSHAGKWKRAAEGRFRMTSSNCTIDRDFSGQWVKRGDTLVLNTDRRPFFRVMDNTPGAAAAATAEGEDSGTAEGDAQPQYRLYLRTSDPAMLRGMRVHADGGPAQRWGRGTLHIPANTRSLRFVVPGMDPVQVLLNGSSLSDAVHGNRIFLRFEFVDLYVPALVDDRWMLDGRILRYIPREGSVRSEAIELKKGKKCWYKP